MRWKPFLKGVLCFGALLVCLVAGILGLGLSAAAAVGDLDQLGPAKLQALERELATELLTLNLQIMNLQEDRERVERRLAELAASRAAEERKLAAARVRLEEMQARLGVWARHLYEEGRLPLAALLLQADSTADFLRRLDFVQLLIEYEYGLLNEVRTLNAAIQERLYHLAVLSAEARTAESLVGFRLAELKQIQQRRAEFLANVRAHSADLAERLAGLERKWQQALTPLQDLLGQLPIALLRDLQPDRVYFQGRNMVVEVRSATINRALRQAAGDGDKGRVALRVNIDPGGITLAGIDPRGQIDFLVLGYLVPVSGGKGVVFRSDTVEVDGLRIDAAALPFLAEDKQGSFSLGDRFQFMAVTDITHEKDLIRFTFRRN